MPSQTQKNMKPLQGFTSNYFPFSLCQPTHVTKPVKKFKKNELNRLRNELTTSKNAKLLLRIISPYKF